MRVLLLLLVSATLPVGAQPVLSALDPEAVPPWRVAVAVGLAAETRFEVASVSVERAVTGPLAAGVRAASYASTCSLRRRCSGEPDNAVAAEVYVLASAGTRHLDVRGLLGGGAAFVQTLSFVGTEEVCQFGDDGVRSCYENERFSGRSSVRPTLVGGLGVDLYPVARLGVGVELRAVAERDRVGLSEAALGLRVRLGG